MEPNPITRAIINATVERGLREIEEDPKRSIRKLTDMGKLFSKGRFAQEISGIIQDLLRNNNSPYYTAIELILRNTERESLKEFGINYGYNCFTFGGNRIRQNLEHSPHLIPWTLILRIDPTMPNSITVPELDNCIAQGFPLGIYSYMIRCGRSLIWLDQLTALFRRHSNGAFICFLPDAELSASQLDELKACGNTLFLLPDSAASCLANAENMRAGKILYGIYAEYGDSDAADWISGEKLKGLAPYKNVFTMLIPKDTCSAQTKQKIGKYCRNARMHPEYPILLFDLFSDTIFINQIISSSKCYFEFLENGDILTQNGVISDFRHTISLPQILSVALPREDA